MFFVIEYIGIGLLVAGGGAGVVALIKKIKSKFKSNESEENSENAGSTEHDDNHVI